MRRFSLMQLFMGTTLVSILLAYTQVGGCGRQINVIECVSFSSDGSRIVVSELSARDSPQNPGKGYWADVSRTVSLLDASKGTSEGIVRQDFKPGVCGPMFGLWRTNRASAVFCPRLELIVALDFGGGNITYYDPDLQQKPIVTQLQRPAANFAVSRYGQLVAASGGDEIAIFEVKTNNAVMRIQATDLPYFGSSLLAFSNDESRIAVVSNAGIHVWDIATGAQSSTVFQGLNPLVHTIAMAPDETLLVCSGEWIRRYDFSGNLVSTLSNLKSGRGCRVSRDGRMAAFIEDGNVVIHYLLSENECKSVPFGFATALEFSPDSQSLAIGDYEGKVTLIDVHTGICRWSSSPTDGRDWPWTWPTCLLVVWGVIAWRKSRRGQLRDKRAHRVQ